MGTLVEEGPTRIRELILWGAEFDKEGLKLAFTQEAAHSKRRILHAQGDSTGREIIRVLIDRVRSTHTVSKIDFAFTRDLIIQNGRCIGALVCQHAQRKILVITARAVLLATGGAGQLFERTTNPAVATGDGMAMAFRAGATLVDMEFIQFHPTALYRTGAPQFLLSEAMRGEGGMLKNICHERFMDRYHPARELAPQLRPAGLQAAILYHDGVEDDARFTLAVARTAMITGPGAVVATQVRADGPILESGRAVGIKATDLAGDQALEIRATRIVDATGAWAAHPEERFAPVPGAARIVPSRGAHIVIPRERLDARAGMTLRIPGRVVFIVPWPDRWIIGTTDHQDARSPGRPTALDEDVDELLEVVNQRLDIDLSRADILATYAGLRPLVGDVGGSTVKASREHKVTTDPTGIVRIGGGKYTTYRIMARDTIDAVLGPDEARRRPAALSRSSSTSSTTTSATAAANTWTRPRNAICCCLYSPPSS